MIIFNGKRMLMTSGSGFFGKEYVRANHAN